MQGLDRDLARVGAEPLLGLVHHAHAALADHAVDHVAPAQHLADQPPPSPAGCPSSAPQWAQKRDDSTFEWLQTGQFMVSSPSGRRATLPLTNAAAGRFVNNPGRRADLAYSSDFSSAFFSGFFFSGAFFLSAPLSLFFSGALSSISYSTVSSLPT